MKVAHLFSIDAICIEVDLGFRQARYSSRASRALGKAADLDNWFTFPHTHASALGCYGLRAAPYACANFGLHNLEGPSPIMF